VVVVFICIQQKGVYMHESSFIKTIASECLANGDVKTTVELEGQEYIVEVSVKPFENKWYRNKAWLIDNYINKNRTMADIAEKANVTPATINQWLVKHEIPTRSRGRRQ